MATKNNNGENYTFAFHDDNYAEFIHFVIQLSGKIMLKLMREFDFYKEKIIFYVIDWQMKKQSATFTDLDNPSRKK